MAWNLNQKKERSTARMGDETEEEGSDAGLKLL